MACEQKEEECQSKTSTLTGALLTTMSNNKVAALLRLPAEKSTWMALMHA